MPGSHCKSERLNVTRLLCFKYAKIWQSESGTGVLVDFSFDNIVKYLITSRSFR